MTTDLQAIAAPEAQPAAALDPQAQAPAAETTADDAPQGEPKPELTPEQRAMRKMERRIHTLTAGRGAAQREAEMLREQLAQRQEQKPQADDDSGEQPAIDAREIDRLANARADDIARSRDIARRSQDVMRAGSKMDDFDGAVNTVADEVPFTDARGRPTPFIEAVLDADAPAAILHYLGNNPEEAAEFAGLAPAQIGRRIARLEDKLAASAAKQTSKAPAPLKPVQPAGSVDADGAKLTDEQWRALKFKKA